MFVIMTSLFSKIVTILTFS